MYLVLYYDTIKKGKLTVGKVGYKPNIPIAVIEAKRNKYGVGGGMQQALNYAQMLDVPFVYSSNGDAFLQHAISGNS